MLSCSPPLPLKEGIWDRSLYQFFFGALYHFISGGDTRYQGRPRGMKKLAPYMAYLRERVEQARPIRLPAPVLLREIQVKGYKGGISQLRSYIGTLRPTVAVETLIRFETPPGQQMQVDWIECRKGKNFLAAFVATLGYSRASYVHFVTNERLETLIECHEQAFAYFGGVVKQVLYDNMKTVILERDAYGPGHHRFNGGMLDFARHYGFQLKVCRPYRAKTKGKVERFNGIIRLLKIRPLRLPSWIVCYTIQQSLISKGKVIA
ncbi:MAG: IS21 family transposase [Candidatus Paracaedibacteraceae bacterium]|nr:IS21 family transposase [Candidatus Paracaedibacteraceae bacterium]